MIKFCKEMWDKNQDTLKEALKNDFTLNECEYVDLLRLVVKHVLNNNNAGIKWSPDKITQIDNGDYQGTLLFLIPQDTYQPGEYEYLMTYVGYGSCSGCDTLLGIQDWKSNIPPTEQQLKDYMSLCRDLVVRMIKPYNSGWRNEEIFETVAEEV